MNSTLFYTDEYKNTEQKIKDFLNAQKEFLSGNTVKSTRAAGDAIQDITSVLTLVGGRAVYGDADFKDLAPPLPPAMPDWSPVRTFGGYQKRAGTDRQRKYTLATACGCSTACAVHGHTHAWGLSVPSDDRSFWGALGCSCWAV